MGPVVHVRHVGVVFAVAVAVGTICAVLVALSCAGLHV